MIKPVFGSPSFDDMSWRSMLQSPAALLRMSFDANASPVWAQETLAGAGEVVVFSYGGSFTEGIRRYVYEPFTKESGIAVLEVVAVLAEPSKADAPGRARRLGHRVYRWAELSGTA